MKPQARKPTVVQLTLRIPGREWPTVDSEPLLAMTVPEAFRKV